MFILKIVFIKMYKEQSTFMSRITVGQLQVNDGPNGIKKLQVHV